MITELWLGFVFLVTGFYLTRHVLKGLDRWQNPSIIIGSGKTPEILACALEEEPEKRYKIIGIINDGNPEKKLLCKQPLLGEMAAAEEIITSNGVQEVIISATGMERNQLLDLIDRIQPHVHNLIIVPSLFGIPVNNVQLETLKNQRAILLQVRNNLLLTENRILKRVLGLIFGLVACLLATPIMLIIALIIKLDSKGPVFYISKRLGRGGQLFKFFKFRTMYPNANHILESYLELNPKARAEWEKYSKLKKDPRITRVGHWLRKYSLDELPQLLNVILGDMSLVGPRPYLPRERERMGFYANTILGTTPGITGLWQVSGRNELAFDQRLALDFWYVRYWNVWLDLTILIKTVKVVLFQKGAY